MKKKSYGDGIFVCLYVDGLIFTSNNSSMIEDFKMLIKIEFEISNLGIMAYFLGI